MSSDPRALALLAGVLLAGCGQTPAARLDSSQVPRPPGAGPRFRPPASAARPASCEPLAGRRFGAHLELFAQRRVVLVPAGIGIASPLRRSGAYVLGGACYAAALTHEPTGVIELARPLTLQELFALWGQPLAGRRLAGFGGAPVAAFVNGVRRRGPPGAVLLRRHSEVVLEIGGYVAPHRSYRFPPGL